MAFQTPVTIEEILTGIHQKQYLLPAIQREFVWDSAQIRQLFDSLLRGYPIGSFLFWTVNAETARDYTFYNFLTDYHERDEPFASRATVPAGQGINAILDGQQRLTALNVGLYGSHAEKRKYAWWNSADAFPKKRLYVNLLGDPDVDELGLGYDLRFLTDGEAAPEEGKPHGWCRVGSVFELADAGPALISELQRRGIDLNKPGAYERLYSLYQAIRIFKPVNYYLETSQDSDKVLDIFVRVNSGGTTLSYSDLLLSMATNQWQQLDAREEVRRLVQELNTGGSRQFSFSKDVVLKTALMVAGVDVRFQVSNFTQNNMKRVEVAWEATRRALIRAATLLDHFGFSARSLTAASVVVPMAYYLAKRDVTDTYLESDADAADRLQLRGWITRSLVKRGIWGSGLDTLLTRIRQILDEHTQNGFPVEPVERGMAALGKSLTFEKTEVDELLQLKYGGQRTFPVLAMLYPGLDLSKEFHEDHVFPRSRFTPTRLAEAGVPPESIEEYRQRVDLLPNLQLLPGVPNMEKKAKITAEWVEDAFPTSETRLNYLRENDLNDLPLQMSDFLQFFDQRQARMRARLDALLALSDADTSPHPS
jgi:Protein of unknown function DUF262